jgi:hypothetical protein
LPPRAIPLDQVDPISPLNDNAMMEFRRLVVELDRNGMLARADLGVVTTAARAKDRADLMNELPSASQSDIAQAENIYLGRLRALGLTLQPSRSVVTSIAKETSQDSIASKIKLHAES